MKTIINNDNNLTAENINIKTNKVRAVIVDNNNKIFLTNYADIYMLPGGKVDCKENNIEALKREIKEELGITIDIKNIKPLITIVNYLHDYPVRNNNFLVNKLTKTTYFIVKYNDKIDIQKRSLTEDEKNGDFSIIKINIKNVKELVLNHSSKNLKNKFFQKELLQVIEEYQKILENNSFIFEEDIMNMRRRKIL